MKWIFLDQQGLDNGGKFTYIYFFKFQCNFTRMTTSKGSVKVKNFKGKQDNISYVADMFSCYKKEKKEREYTTKIKKNHETLKTAQHD